LGGSGSTSEMGAKAVAFAVMNMIVLDVLVIIPHGLYALLVGIVKDVTLQVIAPCCPMIYNNKTPKSKT